MPHKVLFLFDFNNIESTYMLELLMKVTGMRLNFFFGRSVCIVVYGK